MIEADFVLYNVDQLVTMAPTVHRAAAGPLGLLERAAVAALDGQIVWVGLTDELASEVRVRPEGVAVNTHGRTVIPGLVDPSTHPVFAGTRTAEFYQRLQPGEQSDGEQADGILDTVRQTDESSEDALLNLTYTRAETFLLHGTTTIGAYAGYGLSRDSALKSLHVLNRLQRLSPLKVVPIFLAGHAIPTEFSGDADAYAAHLMEQVLPAARECAEVAQLRSAPNGLTPQLARAVAERASELGFRMSAHADGADVDGAVRQAIAEHAYSVDGLAGLSDGGAAALAGADTVPVLLPAATFFRGNDEYEPAGLLSRAGVQLALGTDFNPGTSYTQNLQFVLSLAVLKLRLSADHALMAATLGAAQAVGMADCVGSIEPGKYCDLAVLCVRDYREIPYNVAMNTVLTVVANGRVVVQDGAMLASPGARLRAG